MFLALRDAPSEYRTWSYPTPVSFASDYSRVHAVGLHQRTLLAHSRTSYTREWYEAAERFQHSGATTRSTAYVFDTWSKRQAAIIWPPETSRAAQPGGSHNFGIEGAVWQESESIAWLFVGSYDDSIAGAANVGSLYIYRLDWSREPLDVQLVKRLVPPEDEFSNNRGTGSNTFYGSAVSVSNDGSTLAVSAPGMNNLGAVYVYTRPDGAGEGWGDIEYADGVKLSVAPAPAWGASGTRPFDPDDAAACDAYCSRVSSMIEDEHARFGTHKIDLSADGRVLSVGAPFKRYPFDTAGGAFSGGTRGVGEAYVFVAPEGGWAAAPEAGGTLIAAGEDASNFDPALHHSPGPARRITAPAAVLLARPWAQAAAFRGLGWGTTVSADGSTIAASEVGARDVQIYQLGSAANWSGELLPSATISSDYLGYGGWGDMEFFNRDGSVLLVSNPSYTGGETREGAVDIVRRPASGVWVDVDASTLERIRNPTPGNYSYFGQRTIMDLDYERLAISLPIIVNYHGGNLLDLPGHASGIFLSDGLCPVRIADGVATTTCPITLTGGGAVEVPLDVEDGAQMISAQVTLRVSGAGGSGIVLSESIEVTIGKGPELTEARLGFATDTRHTTSTHDDAPYPSAIATGETTRLRLQLLNEEGGPWGADDADSLLVTTSAGALSSTFGGGCVGAQADDGICALDAALLSKTDAGPVLIDLRHTGESGTAEVRATVRLTDGRTVSAAPLRVALTGPPAALTLSLPNGAGAGLLGVNTPDDGEDAGNDVDGRDTVTLAVTATDAHGAKVAVPETGLSAWLTGPDGARITRGVVISWPLLDADGNPDLDFHGNRQARVDVDRAADNPLPNGEYTLTVRARSLTATQTLVVSGEPATLTLSEPEPRPLINGQFTVTATIADASGAPVPDGTRIRWAAEPLLETTSVVQLSADRVTSGGKSSATYLVIGPGRTSVRATAGDISNVRLLEVSATAIARTEPLTIAEQLSHAAVNRPVSWLGEGMVSASELLAAVEGATSVQLWQYGRWIRYGVEEGQVVPGSFEFMASNGAVLWFSR